MVQVKDVGVCGAVLRPKGILKRVSSELCLQGKLQQEKQREVGSSWNCSPPMTEQVVGVCAQIRRVLFPEECSSYFDAVF